MHSHPDKLHLGIPKKQKTRWAGKAKEKEGQRAVGEGPGGGR